MNFRQFVNMRAIERNVAKDGMHERSKSGSCRAATSLLHSFKSDWRGYRRVRGLGRGENVEPFVPAVCACFTALLGPIAISDSAPPIFSVRIAFPNLFLA